MEYNGSVMDGLHSIMLKTRARPHLLKVSAQALAVLVFLYFLNAFVQTDYLHPLHTMAELAFGIIWLLFCYIVSRTFGIMTILALSFASSIAWGLFIESILVSDFSYFHRAAARLSMGEFAYLFSEKSPTAIAYYAIFHWLLGPTYVTNYIASSVAWTGGAALTYKALRSFFDDERKVKFVCVGLAFCPTFVVFSPVISSESVFFLLSSVCAWLISRHLVGGGSFPYLYIAVGMAAAGLFLTPNPPKDTDGRREDRGRGVRELQGGWPGLHWGRWEVSGRSSAAAQGPLWPPARAGMRGMAREYAAGNSRGPG